MGKSLSAWRPVFSSVKPGKARLYEMVATVPPALLLSQLPLFLSGQRKTSRQVHVIISKEEDGTQWGKPPHRYHHVALRCLPQGDAGLWHSPGHRWEFGVGGDEVEDGMLCAVCFLCWRAPCGAPESSWGPMSRLLWHTLWGIWNFHETKWGGWG